MYWYKIWLRKIMGLVKPLPMILNILSITLLTYCWNTWLLLASINLNLLDLLKTINIASLLLQVDEAPGIDALTVK